MFFRYWKPRGLLSTTLPVKDGVNIYGEGLASVRDAFSAHMLEKCALLRQDLMRVTDNKSAPFPQGKTQPA